MFPVFHPSVFTGVFLLEQERYPEAASQLVEAVALEPEDYDLTVTAATALRQAGVSVRAEDMYRKAATLRPQVRRSVILLMFIYFRFPEQLVQRTLNLSAMLRLERTDPWKDF